MNHPTLKDLTEITGLSRSTVATILRGQADAFAPDTVARVRRAAREAGWKPNQFSKNLQQKRFGALLYIFASVKRHSNASPSLLVGLSEAAEARGYHLMAQGLEEGASGEGPAFLRSRFYDGMIVNMHHFQAKAVSAMEHWLNRFDVPVVWLNLPRSHNSIVPDEDQGAALMAAHLVSQKAKGVLYIGPGSSTHFSATRRPGGLQEILARAGVPFTALEWTAKEGDGYLSREGASLLRKIDFATFDHLVFYSPYLIGRVLAETRGRLPRGVKLLSFDCSASQDPVGLWGGVSFAWDDMARRAVAMAADCLEGQGKKMPSLVLPGQFVSSTEGAL